MAEKVSIEVEASLQDNLTPGLMAAAKIAEELKRTVESIGKGTGGEIKITTKDNASSAVEKIKSAVKQVSNANGEVKITAKDNASAAIKKVSNDVIHLSSGRAMIPISAKDNASAILGTVAAKAKQLAAPTYTANVGAKDNASSILGKVAASAQRFAGKAWEAVVGIKDKVSSGLSKIFNLKNAVVGAAAGVATGFIGQQVISKPVALADEMTQAHIGFETMFGSSTQADSMMDDIKEYARKTPFDTQGTISAVQQMLRAGFDKSTVISDMEKIGNTAAAAGQGTSGVAGIVLALQQMKMSGRVYAQDMNQLVNRGVEAWQFLADGLGKTIPEVRDLTKDGAVTADEAINYILKGMEKYDGMMDKMSNKTVSGILSNLQDTFEIGIIEKWGEGLQHAATEGLGRFAEFLNEIDPMLQKAGTSLEKIGNALGKWAFGKLDDLTTGIKNVFGSDEFKNAPTAIDKIKVAWNKLVSEPVGNWFKQKVGNLAEWLGQTLGKGSSNILQLLFGKDMSEIDGMATSIAGRFIEAFKNAFNGADVLSALGDTVKNMFKSLGKFLPGGESPTAGSYLSALLIGKLGGFDLAKNALGATLGDMDLMSVFKNIGYKLSAKDAAGMSLLSTGSQTLLGGVSAIGAGVGITGLISGINDVVTAVNTSNTLEKKKKTASGAAKLTGTALGTAAGALIGSIVPGAGTIAGAMIGSGIGAAAGSISGKWTDSISEAGTGYKNTKLGLGANAAAGVLLGAAAGSVVPIVGTGIGALLGGLIGAGAGAVSGLWKDKNIAKAELQSRYASREMKEVIGNNDTTDEEIEKAYQKAIKADLDKHFGTLTLSLDEIESQANKIVYGNAAGAYETFSNAVSETQSSYNATANSAYNLEKENWKLRGTVGVELTADEQESYKDAVESYISDAESYVENQHYEFDAAVDILIKDNDKGSLYKTWGSDFYKKLQNELDTTSTELTKTVDVALEDGVVTSDEQATIEALQEKIQNIVDDISSAEMEAKMSALKVKFGGGKLDADSFGSMMSQLTETGEEKIGTAEDAYIDVYANAKFMLKHGDVGQEQFDEMIQQAMNGYQATIDEVGVQIQNFGFENLAEAYTNELRSAFDENVNIDDIAAMMQKNLQAAFESSNVSPKTWTSEDIQKWFGLDNLACNGIPQEPIDNITSIIQQIIDSTPNGFKQNPSIEVDPDVKIGDVGTELKTALESDEPLTVNKAVDIITEINPKSDEAGTLNTKLTEWLNDGEDITIEKIVSVLTNTVINNGDLGDAGDINTRLKQLMNSGDTITVEKIIDVLTQLQIDGAESVDGQIKESVETGAPISADKEVNITAVPNFSWGESGTFGSLPGGESGLVLPDTTMTQTVNVNYQMGTKSEFTPDAPPTANVSQTYGVDVAYADGMIGGYTPPTPTAASVNMRVGVNVTYYTASTSSYSAPSASIRKTGFATGGIVRGKQLSWLAEEGYPEAVIPFNPSRRSRALGLWAETGRRLGVLENAEGGIVSSVGEEQLSIPVKPLPQKMSLTGKESANIVHGTNGESVSVNVGGVQIMVQAQNNQTLLNAIESNAEAITETVAKVMRKSAKRAYANASARV